MLGVAMELKMHQMNVEICMEQPEGFEQKGQKHRVCKLKKSLYRLNLSGRVCYKCSHIFFTYKGFIRRHVDHLYVLQTSNYIVNVIIYVDDLIIFVSNVDMIIKLKSSLSTNLR